MARKDLKGMIFGRWSVTELSHYDSRQQTTFWCCKCQCGNEKVVSGHSLLRGNSQSCGCYNKDRVQEEAVKRRDKKDLIGRTFGRLTVLKYYGQDKHRGSLWECVCSCGNNKVTRDRSLTSGLTLSCGCYNKDRVQEEALKYKDSKESLSGRIFGYLTAVSRNDKFTQYEKWDCVCKCGNETTVERRALLGGKTLSCGCLVREHKDYEDIKGRQFGRLTVLEFVDYNKYNSARWKCSCGCGGVKITTCSLLKSGQTMSCGCIPQENLRKAQKMNIKYKGTGPERKLYSRYKKTAARYGREFQLNEDQFILLIHSKCTYCGAPPLKMVKPEYDHKEMYYNGVDRVDSSKGYVVDNVVTACYICNRAKNTMSESEFKDWINRVYNHQHGVNLSTFFIDNSSLN